jgi:hypothetical protein
LGGLAAQGFFFGGKTKFLQTAAWQSAAPADWLPERLKPLRIQPQSLKGQAEKHVLHHILCFVARKSETDQVAQQGLA